MLRRLDQAPRWVRVPPPSAEPCFTRTRGILAQRITKLGAYAPIFASRFGVFSDRFLPRAGRFWRRNVTVCRPFCCRFVVVLTQESPRCCPCLYRSFAARRPTLAGSRDPIADLAVAQELRRKARRRRYYSSRLDPVRGYIEDQLIAGASYRGIAMSLLEFHHIKVDHSTIRRAVNRWQADGKTP